MHQLGLRALNDLVNCSMSLGFTFLCTINQAKAMTLEGTLGFHKKLARWKETNSNKMNKAKKTEFTENTCEEENAQTFTSGTNEDKCTWELNILNGQMLIYDIIIKFRHKTQCSLNS